MRVFPHLVLLLAAGCATSAMDGSDSSNCDAGSVLKADGYCHPLEDGEGPRPLSGDEDASENSEDVSSDEGGTNEGVPPSDGQDQDPSAEPDETPSAPEMDGRSVFTVDDACGTVDYGYSNPSADARAALERTNCFRNLMGLEPGILHPNVDDASQSHADYMGMHDTITHYEDPSMAGYTGEAVWDRLVSAGYAREPGNSWAEVVAYGYGPADSIDGWMKTVYHRIPYTTPYWRVVGFGQNGDYSSMSFVSPYPNGPRTAVIYPVDGQYDVPLDFNSDIEWPDPAPSHGVVGYPITLTVAAERAIDGENPYNLTVLDASLVDEAGVRVDCIVADPNGDEYLNNTAFMLPIAPLNRDTTYTATMVVEWDGIEEVITATFTTEP